jgi:hypothetical protein
LVPKALPDPNAPVVVTGTAAGFPNPVKDGCDGAGVVSDAGAAALAEDDVDENPPKPPPAEV